MRFGLQRNHALNVLHLKPVGSRLVCRRELLDHRALRKRHIVFISRQNLVRMFRRRLFNHLEERRFLLLAVDDERAAENLVSAMLRIDLREAENLRIGQFSAVFLLDFVQIGDFLRRQRESFLFVVRLQVVDVANRLRLDVNRENLLVETVVFALQHRVERRSPLQPPRGEAFTLASIPLGG